MGLRLQDAQGRWNRDENDDQWLVFDAKDNELARLPKSLKGPEVMYIIRFGRQFELEAYKEGIEHGAKTAEKTHQDQILVLKSELANLKITNEHLGAELDRLIANGE